MLQTLEQRLRQLTPFILVAGFFLRFLRYARVENYFGSGYSHFYDLAMSVLNGQGFAYEYLGGVKLAVRPPVYPLFLAVASLGGRTHWTVLILQAAIGTGTVYLTYLIGRHVFDELTGRLAMCAIAFYPYFLSHDTALQETSLFTFFVALGVWFLLKTLRSDDWRVWAVSGAALGLALLTRGSLTPLIALVGLRLWWQNWRKAAVFAGVFMLVVAPWLIRSAYLIGSPMVTSQTGHLLWVANNPLTFTSYPEGSIDASSGIAWHALSPEEQKYILSLNELDQYNYFWQKGRDYILQHPGQTFYNGLRKIWSGFSWWLNPAQPGLAKWAYFLSYFPLLLLALAELLRRRTDFLFYALFIYFALSSALFWAHTSHRTHLDIYLAVFAAHTVSRLLGKVMARSKENEMPETGLA